MANLDGSVSTELVDQCKAGARGPAASQGLAPRVYVVGDCLKPRLIVGAMLEGFYAAVEM